MTDPNPNPFPGAAEDDTAIYVIKLTTPDWTSYTTVNRIDAEEQWNGLVDYYGVEKLTLTQIPANRLV